MRHPLLVLLLTCFLLSPAAHALTVAELVAKNIAAKGGLDQLHALQSLKLTGKLLVNQGQFELGFVQTKKRPTSTRTEASLQGLTAIQAYDGTLAWQISPFGGRKDPEKMSTDDAKAVIESAEIDGPLVDYQAKGSTVEYLGTEDVDGTLAHKLKVTLKNGDIELVYLDPDYFLEIRVVSQRIEHGAQVVVETDYGDYEKVGGIFFPFAIEAGSKGSTDKQKILVDKAVVNLPLDDSQFRFPVTAAK
jgi:hypothetical protein